MTGKADSPADLRAGSTVKVLTAQEAVALADGVIETMAVLGKLLADETALIKAGRLRDALALETRKGELAGAYMQGLEAVKANALAIARQAPQAMSALKERHESFAQVIALNHAVLATAHAVSEGLMKDLATEAGNTPRAAGYGPGAKVPPGPRTTVLSVSRKA